jgi:hypothetical protein
MTPREGFKYGFLLRCAEEGLTVKEAEARAAIGLEKRGEWDLLGDIGKGITGSLGGIIAGAPSLAGRALGSGIGMAGIGAAGAGALGGYGLAKMQEGDIDPQEVQREELISAYRTQAELARRRAIMDAAQASLPRPRSRHGI